MRHGPLMTSSSSIYSRMHRCTCVHPLILTLESSLKCARYNSRHCRVMTVEDKVGRRVINSRSVSTRQKSHATYRLFRDCDRLPFLFRFLFRGDPTRIGSKSCMIRKGATIFIAPDVIDCLLESTRCFRNHVTIVFPSIRDTASFASNLCKYFVIAS